jgi:hypothetical protein
LAKLFFALWTDYDKKFQLIILKLYEESFKFLIFIENILNICGEQKES